MWVEALDEQYVLFRVHTDGDGVVEIGRTAVRLPVHGIDAQGAFSQDGTDRFRACHGIVADGDARVDGIACRLDGLEVARRTFAHVVADDVGCHHAAVYVGWHVLEQFDHRLGTLAEACQDERTTSVVVFEVVVKGTFDVAHGIGEPFFDSVLPFHPRFQCNLAVVGSIEVVRRGKYVSCQFQ